MKGGLSFVPILRSEQSVMGSIKQVLSALNAQHRRKRRNVLLESAMTIPFSFLPAEMEEQT